MAMRYRRDREGRHAGESLRAGHQGGRPDRRRARPHRPRLAPRRPRRRGALPPLPRLQRALVIDPRPGEVDYPAALVATLAFGAGGQAAAVEQLRPGRPPSARSIAATWGGSTRAFAEQGVLAAIVARLAAADERAVLAAFAQLQEAECGPATAAPPTPPPDEPRDG